MKKLLSTIMALVMLLSLVPMAVAEEGGTESGAVQSNSVYKVTDAAELVWAAENYTGVVKLMNDVEIEDTVIVTKTITLDMNGHKLFNTKNIWNESTGHWSLVSVRENGDLTITGNGTFAAKADDVYAIDLYNDDVRCTIENGTFKGNMCAVYLIGGKLVINGGTFSIQQLSQHNDWRYTLNCLDASFKDGSAQIIVNGGSFYKFDPANNQAEGANTSFTGCTTTQSGDYYNVTAPVAMIGEKGYATLAAAVADVPTNGTETTITLLKDAAGDGVVVKAGNNVVFDFDGHTYTLKGKAVGSTNTKTSGFQLLKDSVVVFKDGTVNIDASNLTEIKDETSTTNPKKCNNFMRMIQSYAEVTIKDMTFDATNQFGGKTYVMSFNHDVVNIIGNTSIIGEAGKVVFDSDNGSWGGYDKTEPLTKVTVNTTGKIVGDIEVTKGGLNIQNVTLIGGVKLGNSETPAENITISGGTFGVAPDAKYLAEGTIVVPGVKNAPYTVQLENRTSEDGKTETTVKVEGDKVTTTITDKTTGTTTETVTDTKTGATTETVTTPNSTTVTKTDATGAKTETKTESKVEGKVTTKTETVTEKNAAGETTEATETVTTVKTENGGTTTVVTEKDTLNGTETTEVTGVTAPTTASDVTLDVSNTTSVEVNKASMSALKGDTVKDVIIETEQATLKLDKDAVETMENNVAANGKMTLDITVTENTAKEVTVTVEAKTQGDKNVFPPETKNTNGEIEITIPYTGTADYLDLWYVTNTSTYMGRFPVVNGFVSFTVTHFSEYNLIPVASSGSSVIKTGAGSSAASTTQTVTTDLTPGSITKVTVDGKVVDAKYYTVSGSNVTFTAEFLKTLKNGSHTVTVENATKIAKGVFTVNNPTTAQSPTTADAGIALYAGMAIASVMGTGVVFTSRKRKNH